MGKEIEFLKYYRYVSKDEGSIVTIYTGVLGGYTMSKGSFHTDFSICPNLIAINIIFTNYLLLGQKVLTVYFIYTILIALLISPIQVSTFFQHQS